MAHSSANIGRLYTCYKESRKTKRVARKVDKMNMVDVIAGIKKSDWRKGIRCKMTGQKVESKNSDWHIRQKIKI